MMDEYKVGELGGDEKIVSEGEYHACLVILVVDNRTVAELHIRLGRPRGLPSRRDRHARRFQPEQIPRPVQAASRPGLERALDQGVLPLPSAQPASPQREREAVWMGYPRGEWPLTPLAVVLFLLIPE